MRGLLKVRLGRGRIGNCKGNEGTGQDAWGGGGRALQGLLLLKVFGEREAVICEGCCQ